MLAANQLINKILQTKDYNIIKTNSLESNLFVGYEQEFSFIVDHYKLYGNIPDTLTFISKFQNFELTEVNESNDYLVDKLYEEYGYNNFTKIIPVLGQKLKEDSRIAYDYIQNELPKLKPHAVCKGIDIIAQAQERYDIYKNRANDPEKLTIKTGLKELDEIFGGWEFGDELVTIVARTNAGKCLQKDTLIRMFDGSCKKVQDIKIGDKVKTILGSNTVLGLHHGISNGFEIIPNNGKCFTVSSDHYLTLMYFKTDLDIKHNKGILIDIKIEDFINQTDYFKSCCFLAKFDYTKEYDNNPILDTFSIKELNSVEYYGFECDGDHRFLLEDGIVTHNSWILMKFLAEAWKQGKRVGLYSGEMNHIKLGYRFDALFNHFSNRALVQGFQTDGYEEYIKNLTGIPNPFIIITQKEFGGRPTVQKIKKFVEENNLEIVGIDQFSLMEDGRASFRDPTRLRLAHIAEDLFLLSSEYRIPVLGLAQANRESTKKESEMDAPGLENIKESDDIAHNSSKCIGMRQSSFGLILDIIKNREGRVGDKLLYNWQIDVGCMDYIPSPDDAARTETRQQFTQQNRQQYTPTTSVNPF